MLPRLAFLEEPCQHTPKKKRFEYDQIKIWFSVTKGVAMKPPKRERQIKTINCHYPDISWNSRCLLFFVKFSHKFSPLFKRFSTFDKNVNLSKANSEAENFLLAFPSLKYLDFHDVSKNSEHIKTFREAWLKSQFPKWKILQNFLP